MLFNNTYGQNFTILKIKGRYKTDNTCTQPILLEAYNSLIHKILVFIEFILKF